jgi:hypothetical protein
MDKEPIHLPTKMFTLDSIKMANLMAMVNINGVRDLFT